MAGCTWTGELRNLENHLETTCKRGAVETSTVPPMEPLKKPVVNIDKQGHIKWGKYEEEIVNKYELRCTDEEKETTISRGPQELQKVANDGVVEFSMKMEPPLVQPGHEYTIQVRSHC